LTELDTEGGEVLGEEEVTGEEEEEEMRKRRFQTMTWSIV
jgi:hypothetical protein